MASENKRVTVTLVLLLSLIIFTTLANSSRSGHFVGNITLQESDTENRNYGSGNWTTVSGGRPVQSDPNPFHHHESRTENGGSKSSSSAAVSPPRRVRSDPNPYHHNYNRTASPP